MRRKSLLLLTAVMSLFGLGEAMADDANRLSLSFTPEQGASYSFNISENTTHGENSLIDGVLTFVGTADFYGAGNAAEWTFTDGVNVDNYDRLIIRLKNDGYSLDGVKGKSQLEVTVSGTDENGSTDASLMHYMASSEKVATCKFTMTEGNETTGIDGVGKQTVTDGACYTLGGVRVNDTTKGLYIKSGKKVIIK